MVIYDNPLTYSIIKNQDFIIIKLNENLENISVSLLKQNTCEENTFDILKDPELLIDTIVYRLPIIDGIYQIKINIQGVITNYNFLYYDNLLKSIINDVEIVLCNSLNCNNCREIDNKDLTRVLLKIISYYILMKEYYGEFLDSSLDCLKCTIEDSNKCLLLNEKILTNQENLDLFNKIISSFYLIFYYFDKVSYPDEDIDKKFKYDKIKHCIISKGLNINCIETKINLI